MPKTWVDAAPQIGVRTRLAEFRKLRGLGAPEVAQAAGISRQTIYAIEAGSYVPNTTVALRISRLLETSVEELFVLEEDQARDAHILKAVLLPDQQSSSGDLLQLCQIDDHLVAVRPDHGSWTLPPADAVLVEHKSPVSRRASACKVSSYRDREDFTRRILIAGCDPAISIVARFLRDAGTEAVLVGRNSTQSLELLRQGLIHVAGTHLQDPIPARTVTEIQKRLPQRPVTVFSYAIWEQGLVIAKGNPKSIAGIHDLSRKDVTIINREPGAGSRALLDLQLSRAAIKTTAVRGYDKLATGHLRAAAAVSEGDADCCVAPRAAARIYSLDFVPLVREHYHFVVQNKHLELPGIQNLIETLGRSALRRELSEFVGYDASSAGLRLVNETKSSTRS